MLVTRRSWMSRWDTSWEEELEAMPGISSRALTVAAWRETSTMLIW